MRANADGAPPPTLDGGESRVGAAAEDGRENERREERREERGEEEKRAEEGIDERRGRAERRRRRSDRELEVCVCVCIRARPQATVRTMPPTRTESLPAVTTSAAAAPRRRRVTPPSPLLQLPRETLLCESLSETESESHSSKTLILIN